MLCKDCGTENAPQVCFCVGCGKRLVEESPLKPADAQRFPWRPLLTAGALALLVLGVYLIVALFTA